MSKYKVRKVPTYKREEWEVVTSWIHYGGDDEELVEYTGSLADCEAWIRLQEGGYLD